MWKILGGLSSTCYISKRRFSSKAEEVFLTKIREQNKKAAKVIPEWEKREQTLYKRYGSWNPTKKLSRQQMSDIRSLSDQMPHLKTVDLAKHYNVSPEAVRRILKSSWVPKESEEDKILERGEKRKEQRRQLKRDTISDIETARTRLTQGRSIPLHEVKFPRESKNLRPKFSENGKVKYDSNNSHGYYNKKKTDKRKSSRPFSQNVGDMIE